jgi:hypothetical protein
MVLVCPCLGKGTVKKDSNDLPDSSDQEHQMSVYPRVITATKWGVVPVAIVVSGALVWQSSYAAFSATTDNPTSNWTTGTVAISDDDGGTALFTATGLKPGSTGQKCILVTSTGNLASTVKLYGTGLSGTLGSDIDLDVEEGTPGTFSSCSTFTGSSLYSGTVAGFAGAKTSFATGVSSWAPTGSGSASKSYRFTYTVKSSSNLQGASAGLGFTWEAQNS